MAAAGKCPGHGGTNDSFPRHEILPQLLWQVQPHFLKVLVEIRANLILQVRMLIYAIIKYDGRCLPIVHVGTLPLLQHGYVAWLFAPWPKISPHVATSESSTPEPIYLESASLTVLSRFPQLILSDTLQPVRHLIILVPGGNSWNHSNWLQRRLRSWNGSPVKSAKPNIHPL